MSKPSAIEPQWVLCDEQIRNVSDFARLPPKERPHTICPLCERPVVLKLGAIRTHHYAHVEEANCSASHPETALHLNTKFHFYHQLRQMLQQPKRPLFIKQNCEGSGCCKARRIVWLKKWDAVEVEYRLDSFRPDIALLLQGKVVGAIEVLVTHAVDERKAAYFEAQHITWMESRAHESRYEGKRSWRAPRPLPFSRCHPELQEWICPQCQQHQTKMEQQREFERNNFTEIYVAKMVDYYFPSGKKQREVFFVKKQIKNGECVHAFVETENGRIARSCQGLIDNAALRTLADAVKQEIENRETQGVIVDRFMKWQRWTKGNGFKARDTARFPFNLQWDVEQKVWLDPRPAEEEQAERDRQENAHKKHELFEKTRPDRERHLEIVARRKALLSQILGE